MLTAFTSAVVVGLWLLLGVSSMRSESVAVDICSEDNRWSKIPVGKRLFITSPNRPHPVDNSNLHCSCQLAVIPSPSAAADKNSSSKEDNVTLSDHVVAVNVSIRATVFQFDEWNNDTRRCWASLSMTSSLSPSFFSPNASFPNGTGGPLVFCPPLNLIDEELASYTFVNTSDPIAEIVFRREELLPVREEEEDPVATFILSIQTNPKVELSISCSQKTTQPPVTSSVRTLQPDFTIKPRTRPPSSSSRSPGVFSSSHDGMPITGDGGRPVTTSETITISGSVTTSEHDTDSDTASWSITDDSDRLSSSGAVTDDERKQTISVFSSRTTEQQTTTNEAGSKSGNNDENLEYYKVKVIAISVGVASVVFVLLIVFMGYELIIHRRRDLRRNETAINNDSIVAHRPDALVCLPYTDPDGDDQWWPSTTRGGGCTSPSAASWPGTEFVGTTSAQRLPDSAFISPQTMPRSCANRPPIPIPVLQRETNGGWKRSNSVKGITSSTFYDVIDLPVESSPSHAQRISAYNESEPDLAASAAVAALSDSGRILTGDYGDYEFPDNINPTYTDMGQGRRGGGGKDKQPTFVLPLTPCYLSTTEDGDSDGHLATNRSNTSVEDNIDQQQQQQQQQQQPESPYDEPRTSATYDNTAALPNSEIDHQGTNVDLSTSPTYSSSSSSSSSAASVLSPDCDHYDRLPPFRNRIN